MAYTSVYEQRKRDFKNPIDQIGLPTSNVSNTITGQATQQNLDAGPNLTSLSDLVNTLNRNAQTSANAARVPGSTAIEQQLSDNTSQLAKGQLPQDVINQIQQRAAERGISTGNDNYLQALGLNSLEAQQMAQGNLTAADARNPVAPIFNPASMLLTPAQLGALQNQGGFLALDWYKALTGQGGYGGGRGGGGGQTPTGQSEDQSNPNWWRSVMPVGTPGMPTSPVSGGGGGVVNDPNYPGTSIPGLPNLTSLLGTQDPGYGYSPDPFGQIPFGGDASNPSYWDFTGGSTYDPFSQYDPADLSAG